MKRTISFFALFLFIFSKKSYVILALILLFFLPIFSHAQVVINEIMYDSPGADDDWVEIYNSGSSPVTIVTGSGNGSWRFVDSGSHVLTLVAGEATLEPSAYAIITNDTAKFITDWTAYFGTIFKSSFSLTNTSNTIYLKDDTGATIEPTISYYSTQGAKGDGNSLSRQTDGTWIPATPTPGIINSNISLIVSTTTDQTATTTEQTTNDTTSSSYQTSSNVTSAHSSPAPLSSTENKIEFEVSAGRDRLTAVGNPVVFVASPTKLQNLSEQAITYKWSFGDGATFLGKTVTHNYRHAGDYAVVLNAYGSDKQAVSRINVRVISPSILLHRISDGVEIENKSGSEINLGGWSITSSNKSFVIPEDTLVSNGKKVVFAYETTGMMEGDITLLNPMKKSLAVIQTPVSNTGGLPTVTSDNLQNIQAKLNEVKETLARISPAPKVVQVAKLSSSVLISPEPKEVNSNVSEDTTQTAVVFEAPASRSLVSTIFSWPVRGFNLIKRLFIEE